MYFSIHVSIRVFCSAGPALRDFSGLRRPLEADRARLRERTAGGRRQGAAGARLRRRSAGAPRQRGSTAQRGVREVLRGHPRKGHGERSRLQLLLKLAGIVTGLLDFSLGKFGWAQLAVPVSLKVF